MAGNKYQERIQQQADNMRKAYAELRAIYDDPTDEQILGVAGDNLSGYQKSIGNKAGNWGTAFGSNALWGTLNKETRAALEREYQESQNANKSNFAQSMNQSVYDWGEGDNKRSITKGMQMDLRNWGDDIDEKKDLTPEQITALNTILTNNGLTNITIPTQQVTSKGANGEDVVTETQLPMSYNDMLDNLYTNMSDEEKKAFDYLGFVERDDDGNFMYVRPHNETFDEKLARREREQARIDLATQQRALERQRARAGLADLAAGIGDMIKASGGAIVTPRDYRAMYDSLTAQQQTNYNNYLARMQALKEQEKEKRRLAEERAYNEKLLANKQAREDALLADARAREDMLLKQAHERELEKINARGQNNLRLQKEKNKVALEKFNTKRIINFGGVNYTYPEGAKNSVISQLLPIVKPYFNDTNGYKSMLSGIESSQISEFGKGEEIANLVICAISDPYLYLTDSDKQNITRVLSALSSATPAAPVAPVTPSTPTTPTTPSAPAKVKIKNKTTGAISEVDRSVYDGWLQSVKNQYEVVS